MIPRLRGWSFQVLPDGFAMSHPDGANVGTIHYRERARPVRRVLELARDVLAGWPEFAIEHLGDIERMTTADGEYAAVVTALGGERGHPVRRDLGFVLTDDFFSSATATSRVPERAGELAALLRELVRHDVHALGIRRRRYEYEPPPGYQPVRQALTVEWIPPDYPHNATTIIVYPANPRVGYAAADPTRVARELEQLGYAVHGEASAVPVTSAGGLAGIVQHIEFDGRGEAPGRRSTALLTDERYVYPVELTCRSPQRWADVGAAFLRLVQSIQPLPGPTAPAPLHEAFLHWMD